MLFLNMLLDVFGWFQGCNKVFLEFGSDVLFFRLRYLLSDELMLMVVDVVVRL